MATRTFRLLLLAALIPFALREGKAVAQREGYSYLSYVGSDVSLVTKGDDDSAARVNAPVMAGDQIATGSSSRAEAILADGNIVRVDSRTELRFDRLARTYESDDERDLLYLSRGAAFVEVRDLATRETAFRLDTDDATLLASGRAVFRVDAGRRGTEVYVASGRVELNGKGGRALLRAGDYAWVSASEDLEIDQSDPPRDRFTRFVEERRDRRPSSAAPRYVPPDYAADYETGGLDDYGSWVYVPAYDQYCWRPSVLSDWRPYTAGTWRWTPGGLTWVSYEPWGWLPYHYGTWTFDPEFGWIWLPGSFYSPAWVYWNYTDDYVGWCPIGYYGHYGPAYGARRTWFGDSRSIYYPHLSGRVTVTRIDPRGWNYVPTGRLGGRLDPTRDVLRGDRVVFRSGDIGVVSTAPLRIDRGSGGSAHGAVQDAIRRIPVGPAGGARAGGAGVNEGLTALLRREGSLSAAARDELKRTFVRSGQDPAYHPVQGDSLGGRRLDGEPPVATGRGGTRGDGASGGGPVRRDVTREAVTSGQGTWREGASGAPARDRESQRNAGGAAADVPVRRGGDRQDATSPRRARTDSERLRRDEGWRSQMSPTPHVIEPQHVVRPPSRSETGWRAPRVIERDTPVRGPGEAPRVEPRREAPVREAPAREAPVRQAPPPQAAPPPPPPPPQAPAPQAPAPPRGR
jgi:FecR protein